MSVQRGSSTWSGAGQFTAAFDAVLAAAGVDVDADVVRIPPRSLARTLTRNGSC